LRRQKAVSGWGIYKPQVSGPGPGAVAVCEQEEWDAMELAEPGRHALLHSGIASEALAEAMARELQGSGTAKAGASKAGASKAGAAKPGGVLKTGALKAR